MTPQLFARELGIQRPILQAPIGSLCSVELATAVSEAGGLGSLALAWVEPEVAAKLVAGVMARTKMPFFANFVLSFKPVALLAALEGGVPIVTFSWGLPGPLVAKAHSYGARVGVQVGTVQGALAALDDGCDMLICQGFEAGGHVQSSISLSELLPAVVAVARGIPVVAAGGLADGEDITRVLALGASAAMLGTRFIASTECRAHLEYKRALLTADAKSTVLTGCFDGGWPYALHRVLRNNTLAAWEASGCAPSGRRPGEADIVTTTPTGDVVRRYEGTPPSCEMQGDILSSCLYAGAGVTKITEILPAAQIVRELWNGATRTDTPDP